ncbi:MAG: hypothetical protein JSR67_08265 [Proteobacteria bacterium]|nr:hypothetical protein [Pseudomonadota bacterium]
MALPGIAVTQSPPARAPVQPDAGFLEFLGSVDGLSELSPDYLSQGRTPAAHQPDPGNQTPAAPPASAPAPSTPSSPPLAQAKS